MKIYIARHGETEWNLQGRKQGRLDSPLTERGIGQAIYFSEMFTGIPICAIYSSPLERALTTALIIGEKKNLEPIEIKDLVECDYGVWEGMTNEEIEQNYPGELKKREDNKFDYRVERGESYKDCLERSKRVFEEIQNQRDETILIVSHEMIIRTLIGLLIHLSNEGMLRIKHPNNIVYVIDREEKSAGYIEQNGKFKNGLLLR